jgi:hypothetical protein
LSQTLPFLAPDSQALQQLLVSREADAEDAAVRPHLAVNASFVFDRGHLYAWQQHAAQLCE